MPVPGGVACWAVATDLTNKSKWSMILSNTVCSSQVKASRYWVIPKYMPLDRRRYTRFVGPYTSPLVGPQLKCFLWDEFGRALVSTTKPLRLS